jgi:hypothetical protein
MLNLMYGVLAMVPNDLRYCWLHVGVTPLSQQLS